jgi:integration host factor subunit beta
MVKSELSGRVFVQKPYLYQRDAERFVSVVIEEIIKAMTRGDRVELRGFGTFSVRERSSRDGRNPKNGAFIAVGEKKFPHFKAGKEMRERLNATTI